jgi:DNA-binding CsgD family transcriptional regulator
VGLRAASPALRLARVLFLRLDTSGQPLRRGHDMKVAPESTSLTAGSGVLSRTAHTGILLLSSSLHVLYINPEGRAQLYDFILQPPPSAYLPPAIRAFCQELFATLPTTPTPKDWEHLHRSHVAMVPSGPILLRAFGVPAPLHDGDGQLLLLIEPAQATYQPVRSSPAPTHQIHLTPREESVTRYLLKGFTNKEIAGKLRLSEHTVKDHLKRVMKKTQATTRTAVLSHLLNHPELITRLTTTSPPVLDQEIHELAV